MQLLGAQIRRTVHTISPMVHENRGLLIFIGCYGRFNGGRSDAGLDRVSGIEQFRRCTGRQTANPDRSDQLGFMEGPGALVPLFALHLGRPDVPDDLRQ